MADNKHIDSDSEAKKWFVLALICTTLYVGTVFTFVINGDLGDSKEPVHTQEAEHGKPH